MAMLAHSSRLTSASIQRATTTQRSSCVSAFSSRPQLAGRRNVVVTRVSSQDDEPTGDKKALRREEEPEEYWVSKGERKGGNPLTDPLAIIGLTAILLPFLLLLVAIATGLVDVSVYR